MVYKVASYSARDINSEKTEKRFFLLAFGIITLLVSYIIGYPYLTSFITIIYFAIIIYRGGQNTSWFIYACSFIYIFQSFSVKFGVSIEWPKIMPFVAFLVLLVSGKTISFSQTRLGPAVVFLVYVSVITLISMFLDVVITLQYQEAVNLGWGVWQSKLSYIARLGSTLLYWVSPFIMTLFIRQRKDFEAFLNGFIDGIILNIFVTLYELLAHTFGLPWVNSASAWRFDLGMFTVNDVQLYRFSGAGGESKHFGAFLICAFVLLISIRFFSNNKYNIGQLNIKIILVLLGVALGAATSAWLQLAVFMLYFVVNLLWGRPTYPYLPYIVVAIFGFILIGLISPNAIDFIDSVFQARWTNRLNLETIQKQEYLIGAMIFYYQDNFPWLKVIFGHGAGGLEAALIPYSRIVPSGGITPNYTIAQLFGYYGIIGTILSIFVFIDWRQHLRAELRWAKHAYVGILIIVLFGSSAAYSLAILVGSAIMAFSRDDIL